LAIRAIALDIAASEGPDTKSRRNSSQHGRLDRSRRNDADGERFG
jgi:hypothetical protein